MTQRTLFRWLLVGLPIGLALSVIASLYLYYHPLDFSDSRPAGPSTLMRKSPAAPDLAGYLRVLEGDLAQRPLSDPLALTRTTKWLESSLGISNMGYTVQAMSGAEAPHTERDIFVELPGRREPGNVILVAARSDTDAELSDSNLSVGLLLTLANAFVGTPQKRTLVFAWYPGAAGPERLRQGLVASGRTVFGFVDLRVKKENNTLAPNVLVTPRQTDNWARALTSALLARLPAHWPAPTGAPTLSDPRSGQVVSLTLTASPAGATEAVLELARALEGTLQVLANQ